MTQPAPLPRMAFLHIPKTAGTAFVNYLFGVYDPKRVAPPYLGTWADQPVSDPDIDLFWGHFFHRDYAVHLPGCPLATFLRHPIPRAISQYRSWSNLAENDQWLSRMTAAERAPVEAARRTTLEQFVFSDDPIIRRQVSNVHTAMLSDERDPASPRFLASAVVNLLHRAWFFGIVERFDESVALLRSTCPALPPYRLTADRENRSANTPPELSARVRRELLRRNRDDLALYRVACRVFAARVRAAGVRIVRQAPAE